jgi:murein DD-endopeptidase MepM/ murein hydrolase activator NlpD
MASSQYFRKPSTVFSVASSEQVIIGSMPARSLPFALLLVLLVSCSSPPPEIQVAAAQPLLPSQTPVPTPSPSPVPLSTSTSTPTLTPESEPGFVLCSPLNLHPLEELSQIIGDPYRPPPPGREERHHGIDFAYYHWQDRDTMLGEPVQSVLPGNVATMLDNLYPYGNMVIVETPQEYLPEDLVELLQISEGESLYLLYAHMNQTPLVTLGEAVRACQPLGEVGMSGNTDIPHLHFETRIGPAGTVFESMRFYSTSATIEEMENYVLWRTSGVYRHFDPMDLFMYGGNP